MNQEKIGLFIKQLRESQGLTQEELAKKIYVTQQTVSLWEKGRNLPDIEKVKMLAELFNVEINDIYAGQKIQNKNEENTIIYNVIKEHENKTKKTFKNSLIIILCLLTIFLTYYFINTYNSLEVFIINNNEDNLNIDGIMTTSKEKMYFELMVDNPSIHKLTLKYQDKIIYQVDDNLLKFSNKYEENFIDYQSLDDFINNLYLIIEYQNKQTSNIKLSIKSDFKNDDIIFNPTDNISDDTTSTNIPYKIKEQFNCNDNLCTLEISQNNKTIFLKYDNNLRLFTVEENEKELFKMWRYYIDNDILYYEELDKNLNQLYQFHSNIDNPNQKKNQQLLEYFNNTYLKEYIN